MSNQVKYTRNSHTDLSPKEEFLGIPMPSESINFQKPSFAIKLKSMMENVTREDSNCFKEQTIKRSQGPKCKFSKLMSIQQNEFLSSRRRIETPPIPATPPIPDSPFFKKKYNREMESEFSITEAKNNTQSFTMSAFNNTFTQEIAKFEDNFYRDERDPEKKFVGEMFLDPQPQEKQQIKVEKELSTLEIMKINLSPFWGKKKPVSILKAAKKQKEEADIDDECKRKVRFGKKVMVKKIEMRNVLMNYVHRKGY